jgi:hypothetical protein
VAEGAAGPRGLFLGWGQAPKPPVDKAASPLRYSLLAEKPVEQEDAVNRLVEKYSKRIVGHLTGFDRLVMRGSIRNLAVTPLFESFLAHSKVLLKDFAAYVEGKSRQLKRASFSEAERTNRPIVYLPSAQTSKEEVAIGIARNDAITEGLICVLHTVELCNSYQIRKDPASKQLVLEAARRKCTHVYHYWIDPTFGFMGARIQTWFPFSVQVWVNGREWLARDMTRHGLRFERRDNCFTWLEDPATAQKLMDQQLKTDWHSVLDAVAARLNPAHGDMLGPAPPSYYWTAYQTEWATDLMFRSAGDLADIYPALTRASIALFGAKDVMRFLGQVPHWHLQGEVTSSFKDRPEGVRVKHSVKYNSVKAYDKQGSVLRIETTINDPTPFKVLRTKTNDPDGPKSRQALRRTVADLHLRAQVSQAVNNRYADALASIEVDDKVAALLSPVSQPARRGGKRYRGIRPFSPNDLALIQAVTRGEFAIAGFRNRDLRAILYPDQTDRQDQRRLSARVSRLLALLRAHRLIRRLPRCHRYVLTAKGRTVAAAILAIQSSQVKALLKDAA